MLEYVFKEAEDSQRKIDDQGLLGRNDAPLREEADGSEKRSEQRFRIADRVKTTIFVDGGGNERLRLVREGFTRDLSAGGACVVLETSVSCVSVESLMGQKVKIRLDLRKRGCEQPVDALSRIEWAREEAGALVLGVQFLEMPEKDREHFERYCVRDAGEEKLLFHLWEAKVAGREHWEDEI